VTQPEAQPSIDELLDQAVEAINRGDRATSDALAGRVLAVDSANADAEELMAAPNFPGEIRRLTTLFADLVDSTALSTRIEPENYRTVVGRYREQVRRSVERYEGHISSTKGDGLLAQFGYPTAHENDVRRAVQAGLDIAREVADLSKRVRSRFGFDISVRVGIHRGIVYLDTAQDDVYGFAANLTARLCGLADPGAVAVSDTIEPLIRSGFELEARLPKPVKGVEGLVRYFRVTGERDMAALRLGPLVGRRHEMEYLRASWAQTEVGSLQKPGLVLEGEAGIGKSRLGWAAVDLAERSHATVLQLIGSPFHTDVGLRPLRRLLERRCAITRASDPTERLRHLETEVRERRMDARTVVPLLAPVLGIEPHHGYQPVQLEGRALYEAIRRTVHDYLMACVRDGPALVLVEDMHWFDEDTAEVVDALLGDDLGGHVLILMTGRDPASLPKGTSVTTFRLNPLSDDEVDQLIVALHPEMTASARRAVRRRCDGVPLYIEEVVAKLKVQATDAAESAGVPDTLYEALYARLRSSPDAVPVAEAAAVIGGRVERSLLHAVIDMSERDVDRVIQELVDARVLDPLDENTWRFRHDLLRDVAAELSPPSHCRRLHGRVADTLLAAAAEGNPDWQVIANHYEQAERYTEAATAYREASDDARLRGALNEARTYLTNAVSQVERAIAGADRDHLEVALRLQRGFLAYAAEGASSANAAADYKRCLEISGSRLRDDEFFSTLVALYGYFAMRADLDRVERLLASVRSSLVGSREWFRPFNDAGFGMLAWYRGDFTNARELLEAAALARSDESAQELDAVWFMPNEGTASIYTHLALARYIQGDLAGAEAELKRTEHRCESIGFPQGVFSFAYARQMEVLIRIEAGQLDRALEVATALSTNGAQHGFDSWAMVGAAQQETVAALAALNGNPLDTVQLQRHIATLTSYVDAWRALAVRSLITFYDAVLARLLIAAGRLDQARDRIQIALQLADETGMHFYDAELLRIRAHSTDDPGARRADISDAIELARSQGALVFELRSALEYFALEGEPGRDALLDVVSRFPADISWPQLTHARALLA
jgi:class 3 adenylate cyclase